MEVNEQLIQAITKAVLEQLKSDGTKTQATSSDSAQMNLAGKTRMRPKRSYKGAEKAKQGTDPKEIVIGVGAAFQTAINATICGIPLAEVLANVRAVIDDDGMVRRVVRVLATSEVASRALKGAKHSGLRIGT